MVGPRVSTHLAGPGKENGNMQKAGTKKSPVLKNAPIKLKLSGYSIIGVVTSNPLLDYSNSSLICSYSLYKFQIYSTAAADLKYTRHLTECLQVYTTSHTYSYTHALRPNM